jgi:hypothetical protein
MKGEIKRSGYLFDEWILNPYLGGISLIIFWIAMFRAQDILESGLIMFLFLFLLWSITFGKKKGEIK